MRIPCDRQPREVYNGRKHYGKERRNASFKDGVTSRVKASLQNWETDSQPFPNNENFGINKLQRSDRRTSNKKRRQKRAG